METHSCPVDSEIVYPQKVKQSKNRKYNDLYSRI